VASIIQFIPSGSFFDDHLTHVLGEAYDSACKNLPESAQAATIREIVARRIIAAAEKGERDPKQLHEVGIHALARIKD
jgi:hypothetical protein